MSLIGLSVVAAAPTAEAKCVAANSSGYAYAGITSNLDFSGIERYISLPDTTLTNDSTQHIAFWMGVNNFNNAACSATSSDICWVQDGVIKGISGNGQTPGVLTAYFETSQPGGSYYFNLYSYSLAQDTFFNVYYTGIVASNGQYQFYGQLQDATGTNHLLSAGYQDSIEETLEAEAEMYDLSGGYCPTIAPSGKYQYFGTNGGGGTGTGYSLDNSDSWTGDSNWSPWTSGISKDQDYELNVIQPNYAFNTSGGSGT